MSNAIQSVKLALGADFLSAFSRLPQKQQRKVREFLDKFTSCPDASALNYERIQGVKDQNLRSVRIDQSYRGIVLKPESGNVHIMLWVDKHDEAYRWAERRVCAIHPDTGTMQVVLTTEAAAESIAGEAPSAVSTPTREPAKPGALFEVYSDEELLSLGVPDALLLHVRAVTSEHEVDRLESILPREAFEGVFLLAAGYSLAEARAELGIVHAPAVDTQDFAAAVEREGSKRQFVVITDSAEMEKVLAAPLDQWRVFLHPSQRRLVEWRVNGPVRVLGSAGTGKTVVAMHRAVWVVRHSCQSGEKVLFTTFTRNLAADISANLKKICTRDEWERIEIVNLDAWVRRFLEKQQFTLRLTYEEPSSDELWAQAMQIAPDVPFCPEFVRGEWDNVVQSNGIETWEMYMGVSRVGRSRRLSRQERQQLWPIFEEYRALLTERGLSEPSDAFRTAARLVVERKISFPYRSVVVDEAQDFGCEAFRLMRLIVPSAADDMFIVGDAHQRIYGHQVVLSRCGIDILPREAPDPERAGLHQCLSLVNVFGDSIVPCGFVRMESKAIEKDSHRSRSPCTNGIEDKVRGRCHCRLRANGHRHLQCQFPSNVPTTPEVAGLPPYDLRLKLCSRLMAQGFKKLLLEFTLNEWMDVNVGDPLYSGDRDAFLSAGTTNALHVIGSRRWNGAEYYACEIADVHTHLEGGRTGEQVRIGSAPLLASGHEPGFDPFAHFAVEQTSVLGGTNADDVAAAVKIAVIVCLGGLRGVAPMAVRAKAWRSVPSREFDRCAG